MERREPPPAAPRLATPADLGPGDLGRRLGAYVALVHPLPILFVLAATAVFAALFAGGLPAPSTLLALLLAMLGGQLAIGAVNELVDVELDAASKPGKPIPAGLVSRRGAVTVVVVGLFLMVVAGVRFGPAAFALLVAGTGLGLAYDLWLKRTPLSWLPYVAALPLLPIWVRTALLGFDGRLLALYPLGVGAVVAIHLAQALPDSASDRAAGLRNPVSRLGEERTLALACLLAATTPLAALTLGTRWSPAGERSTFLAIAVGAALLLVAVTAALYVHNRPRGVRAAFPLLTLAAIAAAIGWVVGTT